VKKSEQYKAVLREKGLLTRDPRMKETRKVGMGGKARRKRQSPKR
jgi:small subunit ribosomal protein S9